MLAGVHHLEPKIAALRGDISRGDHLRFIVRENFVKIFRSFCLRITLQIVFNLAWVPVVNIF
jgi:hypothetical protein